MPIQAVTEAIRDLLNAAMHDGMSAPLGTFSVYVGPPDADQDEDELILFPMRITPSAETRNAERIRRFPTALDPPRRLDMAVPIDLHYLVTAGSPQNTTAANGLRRLSQAIRAIETASPIAVPSAFQDAVWLSLEPLSSDELSRIWGLFPNFNCRTSFIFRASPIWIDPLRIPDPAEPVISEANSFGTMEDA
jgi:Pvc16 N-terminal domain